MTKKESVKVRDILIGLIDRPEDPDRLSCDHEYIRELAASIAEVGLLSPILLSPRDGRFELVAGDCRYQAFLSLGRLTIPAVVQDLEAENISIMRATENLQRKDLTVIEEARIYKKLHDNHGMSWDTIGKRVGKSPALVRRRYELLKMPEMLIKAMHEKSIGYAVAEELCRLTDLGRTEYLLYHCIQSGATKDLVRDWVKEENSKERQKLSAGVEGGDESPIWETKPVYASCDLCKGPAEVTKVVSVRMCPECWALIKQNI